MSQLLWASKLCRKSGAPESARTSVSPSSGERYTVSATEAKIGALRWIRTSTGQGLSLVPLPVGLLAQSPWLIINCRPAKGEGLRYLHARKQAGLVWCVELDSNQHCATFKEAASARWAIDASFGIASEIRTRVCGLGGHVPFRRSR